MVLLLLKLIVNTSTLFIQYCHSLRKIIVFESQNRRAITTTIRSRTQRTTISIYRTNPMNLVHFCIALICVGFFFRDRFCDLIELVFIADDIETAQTDASVSSKQKYYFFVF